MPSLNVSLPAPLREWIDAQIKGGRYGNASEYLRELIRRDQERQAQERLEELLLEGIKSGTASPLTQQDWAELRTDSIGLGEDGPTHQPIEQLAAMPEIGVAREHRDPALAEVRMWRIVGFDNYLMFYRPLENGIEIIRVLHAKRDIAALFRGRS